MLVATIRKLDAIDWDSTLAAWTQQWDDPSEHGTRQIALGHYRTMRRGFWLAGIRGALHSFRAPFGRDEYCGCRSPAGSRARAIEVTDAGGAYFDVPQAHRQRPPSRTGRLTTQARQRPRLSARRGPPVFGDRDPMARTIVFPRTPRVRRRSDRVGCCDVLAPGHGQPELFLLSPVRQSAIVVRSERARQVDAAPSEVTNGGSGGERSIRRCRSLLDGARTSIDRTLRDRAPLRGCSRCSAGSGSPSPRRSLRLLSQSVASARASSVPDGAWQGRAGISAWPSAGSLDWMFGTALASARLSGLASGRGATLWRDGLDPAAYCGPRVTRRRRTARRVSPARDAPHRDGRGAESRMRCAAGAAHELFPVPVLSAHLQRTRCKRRPGL